MENGTHQNDVLAVRGRLFFSLDTLVIILSILTFSLLVGSGCDDRSETTNSHVTSLRVSPTPAMNPTTNQTTISPDEPLDMKLKSAPDLAGADKLILEINGLNRIVYRALNGNPYGLSEGEIIGEFKYEVYLGEKRTGGVALSAPAVLHFLKEALVSLPAEQAHWLLPLPVDITDCLSYEPILIDRSAKPIIDRPYYIRISSSEELGIVNILDAQQKVVIDEFKIYGLHYIISQRSNESDKIIEGEEMAFLFVIARFQSITQMTQDFTFGDRVGTTQDPVLAGLTSVRGPFLEHQYDCILSIEGCPVFVMANQKLQK